jgi:hypothetical protein
MAQTTTSTHRCLNPKICSRLHAYTLDKETWHMFETVPLAHEVKAIQHAVAVLEDEQQLAVERKPWWFCTIYPGSEISEEHLGGSVTGCGHAVAYHEEHRQI